MATTLKLGPSSHIDTFTRDNLPPFDLWPELRLDRPEFQYPDYINAAVELTDRNVERGFGDRVALIGNGRRRTYKELTDWSNKLAHALVENYGVKPGNRVLIRSGNDRDGVINERIPGEYVKSPDEFIPVEGFEEAIRLLSGHFERILVVTNQAGIGKGLMTLDDLSAVHRKMLDLTEAAGGRIDGVYFCPHRSDNGCPCRKPATGMAWLALADFPEIDLTNAWIAGDSISDMAFGQALGLRTVLIHGKSEEAKILAGMKINHRFASLLDFARFIC